jgi:hypothetical protein
MHVQRTSEPLVKGGDVKRALLAVCFAALSGTALAQPPQIGTVHSFVDPIFRGTVFCDTYDQVLDIASAEHPDEVFFGYLMTRNERLEPTCAAVLPTGLVVDVRSVGIMKRDGKHYLAFAVETQVGEITGFALYLERFEIVYA